MRFSIKPIAAARGCMNFIIKPMVAAAALGCGVSMANTGSEDFFYSGNLVATLSWSDTATATSFTLDFLSAPDPSAFMFNVEFNGPNGTFTDTSTDTVATGVYGAFTDAGLDFTWKVSFPTANTPDRFTIGETATWEIAPAGDFGDPTQVHINAFLNGESIKLTPAIPEPSTYAMLFAGLGAIGFMARRRRAE
jgi:hypothetical protein